MRQRTYKTLACGVLAALFLTGCGGLTEEPPIIQIEQEEPDTQYTLREIVRQDVERTEKVKCTYKQLKDQEVAFSLGGRRVEKVYVRKGDTVKKGQLLAQLSGGNLDASIEALEYSINRKTVQLEFLEKNEAYDIADRWVQEVYNGRGGAEENVKDIQKSYQYQKEDLQDAIALDKQEVAKLKAERSASFVYAEMDGVVHEIKDDLEYSTSKEGEVIMTIIDSSQCVFVTETPQYMDFYRNGEVVEMTLSGKMSGEVQLLPYKMEEWGDEQYFSIYSSAVTESLNVGHYGYIRLITDKKEQVLTVPNTALFEAGGEQYVYVVGANGMREVLWITTGLVGDDYTEVLSGLQEGDKVISR